jgi:hypothetical protein
VSGCPTAHEAQQLLPDADAWVSQQVHAEQRPTYLGTTLRKRRFWRQSPWLNSEYAGQILDLVPGARADQEVRETLNLLQNYMDVVLF